MVQGIHRYPPPVSSNVDTQGNRGPQRKQQIGYDRAEPHGRLHRAQKSEASLAQLAPI